MKFRLGRACFVVLLGIMSTTFTGCLTSSEVSGGMVNPPSPPPPPPPPGGNSAPVISGNPAPAVVVGQAYSFTPVASDPDNDALSFTIQNQPSWANFNASTGALSGVAPLGTEGNYPNIVITVSDGTLAANLPQFSINVTQVALGSATLSWNAPTQNTDGSALLDLAAYKIYYGTTPGSYTSQVTVNNPGTTMYVVDNLVPNTYYFVSTSINAAGIESAFSNMASTTVN